MSGAGICRGREESGSLEFWEFLAEQSVCVRLALCFVQSGFAGKLGLEEADRRVGNAEPQAKEVLLDSSIWISRRITF